MRLATVALDDALRVARIVEGRVEPLVGPTSMKTLAAGGLAALRGLAFEATGDVVGSRTVEEARWAPAVPDPGAIYTVGLNYEGPGAAPRPERPLIYGKAPTSVAAQGATLTWDRSLTANVDAECELGVVIGDGGVFGYTIINDISSRDPWLDGDHWLLGKSMAGFCPVGPWIVTADELDPSDLRLGCTINGTSIQEGTTADLRFSIPEIVSYLGRHTVLRPGDLIATGTPVRLTGPPGPDRHLEPADVVTVWIEGIGELTTLIA